jgi:Aspartyl protease
MTSLIATYCESDGDDDMKTVLLSTVAVLVLSSTANATDFVCSAPQFSVGRQSIDPQDTVDRIEIRHATGNPEWQIHHRFQNGTMVMRQEQYAMIDASNPNFWAWRGRLRKNGSITMIGELRRDYRGQPYYTETQFADGRVIMRNQASCNVVTAVAAPAPGPYRPLQPPQPPIVQAPPSPPAPPPPAAAPAPQPPIVIVVPTPAPMPITIPTAPPEPKVEPPKVEPPKVERDSVSLSIQNDRMMLNVGMGDRTVTMILDTGATTSVVTNKVAEYLVSKGQARWAGRDDYMLADGSVKTVQTIVIFEIRIGKHVVRNATAGVTDSMLLGFSVLRSIGPFMIDTRNNELVFVTVEARADTDKQSDASPVAPPPAPSFEEFWPEGTRPSKECIEEITKSKDANAITQKCKEEGERWATQLQKNMKNPAFKKQITDIFERN